ncbi:ABC transporter permease [Microlunatus capsulatus]|uniref:Peptide/nickel transport system permease protein n=1 Tax=Microlunatus capsulatus TaxID=99117 RepID=A0ABS4Z2M8_9ACTN|nr:ABC transporter permease [Microlunatus capsulatus]MBP2415251.1 peptide/nickel transport system permease protein [Microlunatus capsulatus]
MERFGLRWSRLGNLVPVLFGITVVSFVLIRLVPGDPASQILGNRYTPEAAQEIRASLGLDRSILTQYGIFVRSAATGSFGESYQYHRPVGELLLDRMGPSLLLVGMTAALCALVAVPLGLLAALRRGGLLDQGTRVFFTIGYALPGFLVGVVLILVFGLKLRWFPIGGYGTGFAEHVHHLVLPAVTLAIPFSTVLVRSLRSSTIGVLDSDFITIARLKGISGSRVIFRHVLRNAIAPVAVVFGINLAFLVGGSVVVENVFSIPGFGSLLVGAVSTRDYPVVQAVALVLAVFVLAVNVLTDVVHSLLDPRLAVAVAR